MSDLIRQIHEMPVTITVFCSTHEHYLVRASSGGTTWTDDRARARKFPDRAAATEAADVARWLDHRPGVLVTR